MSDESIEDDELFRLAAGGDESALASLFGRYRKRLRQMVRLRLDRRLQSRIDPADVLQEAYLDLVRQLPNYLEKAEMPFFLWLRLLTGQRLMRIHRQHLGAAIRDADREVSLHQGGVPLTSSDSLTAQLFDRLTPASQAALRVERRALLQAALDGMDVIDREVIALRHFEDLSNKETAEVLGLSKAAASNRYVRAMARLQSVLEGVPGLLDQP